MPYGFASWWTFLVVFRRCYSVCNEFFFKDILGGVVFFYLYSSTCTSNLGRSWPTTNSAITIFFFFFFIFYVEGIWTSWSGWFNITGKVCRGEWRMLYINCVVALPRVSLCFTLVTNWKTSFFYLRAYSKFSIFLTLFIVYITQPFNYHAPRQFHFTISIQN